ncbi:DNA-binding protein [Zobellia sp. OII3]|uniref:helix-turn-helix domain-containing protein n=1 Tax=Zobellia sp. OII3 TaxID=2034520 RepID=UPI000B533610|nr:helix-turn-helix domain-containing protein [Zobellia sp. OII3]OWW24061.1 DNA-binding protein [Zobellia sp. OII3]
MKQVQLISLTPEQLQEAIIQGVKTQIDELKEHFQPKEPTIYISRQELAELLHCDISTVHNLTVKGILTKYQIGGRVLYKRDEVENAIIKIKN